MGKPSKRRAEPKPEEAVECPRSKVSVQGLSEALDQRCTLRNVTVGGGCRENKKSSSPYSSSTSSKKIKDQTLTQLNTKPLINTHHDHIDTTDDLRQRYDHHDSDHLSCFGNPSHDVAGSVADLLFLGNFDDFQGFWNDTFGENGDPSVGFNGETMMLYNNEDMSGSTSTTTTTITSDVGAVATMKQDGPENGSDLWSLPWQLIEDAGAGGNNNHNAMAVGFDLDSVTDNWHDFFHSI
ncbi:dof zinc finger protein DOF2.1-like [Hibiscus syriacus]|uniref:dof zinc finger protein DOF2.1-like n=1 Tax=Hibiscus syriacus TaxID=106335 RepID=UPI001922982A|nr:dof zinc finger protein DOF2.1-like [Hibiscus syriacus]